MQLNNRVFRFGRAASVVVFMVIAAIILSVMGYLTMIGNSMSDGWEEIPATISHIEEVGYGEDASYDAYVDYTYGGNTYTNRRLNTFMGSWNVGDEITVRIDPENPENVTVPVHILSYILFGLAGVMLLIAVSTIVKNKKRKDELKAAGYDPNAIFNQPNVTYEPDTNGYEEEFFFHPTMHFTQGFLMEDKNGAVVYEAKFKNFTVFRPSDVDFINNRISRHVVHKVGHTVTVNGDSALTANSYFSFDGENVFSYLLKKGIHIQTEVTVQNLGATYTIVKQGQAIARATMCGVRGYTNNPTTFGQQLGNIGANGFFKVETHDEDLDTLFLVLFAIGRTEQLVYD